MRFFRFSKPVIIDTLIGGFRVRKSGQLSIEHRDKYLEEVQSIIMREMRMLTDEERKKIKRLKQLLQIVDYPFVNRLFKIVPKIHQLFDYPEQLSFNFPSYSFGNN
ncbi:MAG: hypothetical protein NZ519_11440 [Bacteroidia bacterium]|nr:hypothetical protein [Bacteroidia bacterium]MDW8303194.1 hypothetical protein [Bacteroidia bacterium]